MVMLVSHRIGPLGAKAVVLAARAAAAPRAARLKLPIHCFLGPCGGRCRCVASAPRQKSGDSTGEVNGDLALKPHQSVFAVDVRRGGGHFLNPRAISFFLSYVKASYGPRLRVDKRNF